MEQNKKILLIMENKLIRCGVRAIFDTALLGKNVTVVEANDDDDGLKLARKFKFELILLGMELTGATGEQLAKSLFKMDSRTAILILSDNEDYGCIDRMVRAGVKGYVLKSVGTRELVHAAEEVMKGKNYFSNQVAVRLLSGGLSRLPKKGNGAVYKGIRISNREREVLKLISNQFTNEEIARELFISKRTVDTHRQNLKNKLNVKNTAGLVRLAMELLEGK